MAFHSRLFASARALSRVAAPLPRSTHSLSRTIPAAKFSTTPTTLNGNGNGNGTKETAVAAPSPSQVEAVESVLPDPKGSDGATDWSRSYHGLSSMPFSSEVAEVLLAPIDPMDVEMKPDGLAYLPEIKYRRILNKAFGPGGWGLAPRSETNVGPKIVSREYALVCLGRLVAIARGEQEYFDPSGIPTATEGCKSNALMRCCKDLGIASELWDPRFIRDFKANYCVEVFAEHVPTKKKKKLWRRKDQGKFGYPYQE
ncbi:mitochondrial genome maintenance MGM101 [Pholiota conissans]|uniref:Mitochondrial genome maintenance protein MGM101 n=1 Tax=Pholiota conissans TaxID=109636 RepID=A0A9P5Z010_9AGAR|nr:mitochondrial genome maintenance MGM101 [Pholiota conissans]